MSLAEQQSALVEALVAGGAVPAGFDAHQVEATRRALLRKRAGEAAKQWPLLAASLGAEWVPTFAREHAGHASRGPLCDGWDVAGALRERGDLAPEAVDELAHAESRLVYDGHGLPRPRRVPRVNRWFGRARR